MKVALFHTTLPEPTRKVGGVEAVVHRLGNALAQTGEHDVTVFSLTPRPADALYEHVRLFPRLPWLATNSLLRWFVLPVLLNLLRFRGYDVLHLHGDDWFFVRRSVPTIRTMHGSALHEAKTATSRKRRWAQRLLYPLEHLSVRLATAAAAIGPETAQLYRIPTVINNGVDLSLFSPGTKTAAPSILFVGTWAGRKRGAFLYDRFVHEVIPSVPDATLHLVTDTVSDACAAHPQVVHHRRPSDAALAALYRQSWVFAYPSTYEGFGLPYLESMASGTPVLCSPNHGADYVLDGGRYGRVVEDGDFGPALVDLLRDGAARQTYEAYGLDRVHQFDWSVVADAHGALYRQAVGAPSLPSQPVSS
jgi:glycosyltransferase involved in cell wall biosynthesis